MELGHTKVTTTEIYAKFLPEKLKEDFPTLVKVKELTEKLRKKAIKDTHIKDTNKISYFFSP